jgi:hypothetical protein
MSTLFLYGHLANLAHLSRAINLRRKIIFGRLSLSRLGVLIKASTQRPGHQPFLQARKADNRWEPKQTLNVHLNSSDGFESVDWVRIAKKSLAKCGIGRLATLDLQVREDGGKNWASAFGTSHSTCFPKTLYMAETHSKNGPFVFYN